MKIDKFEDFNKGSLVVAGFPGIGKSHLKDMGGDKISDSDSSKFPKDSFPENYIDHIQSLLGKKEIILVSTHKDVLMEMERVGIDYILVYPDRSLKSEYLDRYRNRKSPTQFVNVLDQKWDSFMKDIDAANPNKRIILKSGEYLMDKLTSLYL
jgi:hypothetical protein